MAEISSARNVVPARGRVDDSLGLASAPISSSAAAQEQSQAQSRMPESARPTGVIRNPPLYQLAACSDGI